MEQKETCSAILWGLCLWNKHLEKALDISSGHHYVHPNHLIRISQKRKYKQYQELAKTLRFFDPFCNYYQWQHSKTALWLLLFLLQNSLFFLSIGCKTISGSAINLPGLVYLLCSKIMFFQNRALVSVRTNWIMVNCLRDKWQHTKGLRSVTRVYHLVTYNRL